MIFVTTGTQEPFDRLLEIVAKFAEVVSEKIIIQAKTDMVFQENVEVFDFLSPLEYDSFFSSSRLVISHAGMGSIISALYKNKPLIIFPRIAALGEHRNEHQMATAKKMHEQNMVHVAFSDEELFSMLKDLVSKDTIEPLHKIGAFAGEQLIESLDEFIRR